MTRFAVRWIKKETSDSYTLSWSRIFEDSV